MVTVDCVVTPRSIPQLYAGTRTPLLLCCMHAVSPVYCCCCIVVCSYVSAPMSTSGHSSHWRSCLAWRGRQQNFWLLPFWYNTFSNGHLDSKIMKINSVSHGIWFHYFVLRHFMHIFNGKLKLFINKATTDSCRPYIFHQGAPLTPPNCWPFAWPWHSRDCCKYNCRAIASSSSSSGEWSSILLQGPRVEISLSWQLHINHAAARLGCLHEEGQHRSFYC